MRQSVIWVQPNGSYVNKHHLNPMCPYVDLETARKKPANAYPELDVCSWCEERYENWDGFHDEIGKTTVGGVTQQLTARMHTVKSASE